MALVILKRYDRMDIRSNMNKPIALSTIALIAYMALIFHLSSLPGDLPSGIEILAIPRIILHVGEYAVLGLLANLVALQATGKGLKSILYSSIFSSLYGVTDEIHQHFVPTRCFDVYDICADTVGGIVGSVFFIILLMLARKLVTTHEETKQTEQKRKELYISSFHEDFFY